MLANLLLFPYWVTLKLRHLLYDKGIKKTYSPSVPSICIGNITKCYLFTCIGYIFITAFTKVHYFTAATAALHIAEEKQRNDF